MIVLEFADIRISYQLLLRRTHSFSRGLLTKEHYSIYILLKAGIGLRFPSRSVRLEKTAEIQARYFPYILREFLVYYLTRITKIQKMLASLKICKQLVKVNFKLT